MDTRRSGRARKRCDRRGRAKRLYKQRRRRKLRKNARCARKKLLGRRRAGVLLCRGVLRQRANGLQGRRKNLCDLQRRLCRGERGRLLRGVGVFLKGYVASQASSSRASALRACKPSFKCACNMLKLAKQGR